MLRACFDFARTKSGCPNFGVVGDRGGRDSAGSHRPLEFRHALRLRGGQCIAADEVTFGLDSLETSTGYTRLFRRRQILISSRKTQALKKGGAP